MVATKLPSPCSVLAFSVQHYPADGGIASPVVPASCSNFLVATCCCCSLLVVFGCSGGGDAFFRHRPCPRRCCRHHPCRCRRCFGCRCCALLLLSLWLYLCGCCYVCVRVCGCALVCLVVRFIVVVVAVVVAVMMVCCMLLFFC